MLLMSIFKTKLKQESAVEIQTTLDILWIQIQQIQLFFCKHVGENRKVCNSKLNAIPIPLCPASSENAPRYQVSFVPSWRKIVSCPATGKKLSQTLHVCLRFNTSIHTWSIQYCDLCFGIYKLMVQSFIFFRKIDLHIL